MTSTTTNSNTAQQSWSNQYNALKNSLNQAAIAVDTLQKIYDVGRPSSPALTTEQQRILEQAYQRHLEASASVTSFVTDTPTQLLRLSMQADAIAADTSRSLFDRETARQTSTRLTQGVSEFLQIRTSEAWQTPGELQYKIGNYERFTSATGIQERIDSSTMTGRAIATWELVKNQLSAQFDGGTQTLQQLRDNGFNVPTDYELCVNLLSIVKGKALTALMPAPDFFKDSPTLPGDWKTTGERVYQDGIKSIVNPEEQACKLILDKRDVKELFRKYGLADDTFLNQLDALSIDEISFNVSREVLNQALATETALSSLTGTSGLTAVTFDQQVQQTTASLSSSAALMRTFADNLEAVGLQTLDGAKIGANIFAVDNDQLHLNTVIGGQNVMVLASLDFGGETVSDAGPGGALHLTGIQTINGQTPPEGAYTIDPQDLEAFGFTFDNLLNGTVGAAGQALITGLDPATQAATGAPVPQVQITFLSDGQTWRSLEVAGGSTFSTLRDDEGNVISATYSRELGAGVKLNEVYDASNTLLYSEKIEPVLTGANAGQLKETLIRPDGSGYIFQRGVDGQEIADTRVRVAPYDQRLASTFSDVPSFIDAIKSGKPLPIVANGLRLLNDLDQLYTPGGSLPQLGTANTIAAGALSLYNLNNALKHGDAFDKLSATAFALNGTTNALIAAGVISKTGAVVVKGVIAQLLTPELIADCAQDTRASGLFDSENRSAANDGAWEMAA